MLLDQEIYFLKNVAIAAFAKIVFKNVCINLIEKQKKKNIFVLFAITKLIKVKIVNILKQGYYIILNFNWGKIINNIFMKIYN